MTPWHRRALIAASVFLAAVLAGMLLQVEDPSEIPPPTTTTTVYMTGPGDNVEITP